MLSTSCKHKGKTWKTSVSMVDHLFAAAAASPGCVFCSRLDHPASAALLRWARVDPAVPVGGRASRGGKKSGVRGRYFFSNGGDMKNYDPFSGM